LQLTLDTFQTRDQLAATYLHHLQALASEISAAMGAIAANSLTTLQESIAKQELLCESLAPMVKAFDTEPAAAAARLTPRSGAELEVKIGAARRAVVELNLQYASLLKHSGRSIALLLSLCRSHTGFFQEARGPRLKQQTWSCEA
jgi:hypothetical protein